MQTPNNPDAYSETPLIKKLGYKPTNRVVTVGEPEWFAQYLEQESVSNERALPCDWLHLFVSDFEELMDLMEAYNLDEVGTGIWISWPKKTASKNTTISEQSIRDGILPLGWVDTKVCSIDKTWSGLKFLRRKNS